MLRIATILSLAAFSASALAEVADPPMTAGQRERIVDATVDAAAGLNAALYVMDRQGRPVVSPTLLARTQCIVTMRIQRAAFLLGGEGGDGVMACRAAEARNGWSAPSYVRTGGFNLSAAIGWVSLDLAMLITDPAVAEGMKTQANFDVRAYAQAVAADADAALIAADEFGMAVVQADARGLFAGVGITFTSMGHMQWNRNQIVYAEALGDGTPVDQGGRPCTSYVLPGRQQRCEQEWVSRTGRTLRTVTAAEILATPSDAAPLVTRAVNDAFRNVGL